MNTLAPSHPHYTTNLYGPCLIVFFLKQLNKSISFLPFGLFCDALYPRWVGRCLVGTFRNYFTIHLNKIPAYFQMLDFYFCHQIKKHKQTNKQIHMQENLACIETIQRLIYRNERSNDVHAKSLKPAKCICTDFPSKCYGNKQTGSMENLRYFPMEDSDHMRYRVKWGSR